MESDYTWVTADINVHNWEQRKVTVSEAVIYCASALKESYLSINRKAKKLKNLSEIFLFYSMTKKAFQALGHILLETTNSFM